MSFEVRRVENSVTHDFILNKHYAKRIPIINFAFGLYIDGELEGILTVGRSASAPLAAGVCGPEHKSRVYELNRLVVNDGLPANSLSRFVSKCLKMLKSDDLIIVSYSDTGMGHHGYIYQATNWIYTGMTVSRTDKYMPGNKHPRYYTEEYAHLRKVRTSKHRYIYFTGKSRKIFLEQLNYPICPYPKGDNDYYKLGDKIKVKVYNRDTGEYFYE